MVDPESGVVDPESGVVDPESGVVDPESGVVDPESGVADPESGVADPESGVANPESGVADPESSVTDTGEGTGTDLTDRVLEAPVIDDTIPASAPVAGWGIDENGNTCYYNLDGTKATGYFVVDGKWYYAYQNGAAIVWGGWFVRDDGKLIHTDNDGSITSAGFLSDGSTTYYVDHQGVQQQGYFNAVTPDNTRYYAYSNGSVLIYQGWFIREDSQFIYSWDKGAIYAGFVPTGDVLYHVDEYGIQSKGYFEESGKTYYANTQTAEVNTNQGWFINQDNEFYYSGKDGVIGPEGIIEVNGTSYYVDDKGVQQRGYIDAKNGNRYYAYANGALQIYKGFFIRDDGTIFYADDNGVITFGFKDVNRVKYYVDEYGVQKKGYFQDSDNRYYAHADGSVIVASGWFVRDDGKLIYTDEGGKITKGFKKQGATTYYADEYGVQVTGYFNPGDGYLRYAHANGSVIVAKGWFIRDDGQIIYTYDDGKIAEGFLNLNGLLYYVDAKGVQQKGVFQANNSKYYYGDLQQGYLAAGWMIYNKNTYYFIPQVYYAATGPYTVDGTNYLFSDTGILQGVLTGNYGIDVSMHQGVIDWNAVKNSGMQFAIIRILGANNSGYYIDPYFETNMNGALGVGIQVGAYIYSYAFNTNEILQEVQLALPALLKYKDRMTYPVYIDYEDKLLLQNTSSNEQRTEILRTGMDELNKNGFLSGFYTYYNFAQNYINTQQLIDEGYDFWVAHTGAGANPWNGASMWQYSHSGSVPGINGNVDMNFSHVNYNALNQTVTVYDSNSKTNVTGKIRDIVARMVQNEVGSGIGLTGQDKMKLLAAQTVASHSWLRYQISHDVATPTVGLSAPSADVLTAANRVIRFMVQYNGSVANTAYTASSGAYTNSSQNMGWGYLPYLTSVESKYDAQFDTGYYVGGSKKSCFPWTWTTDQSQMRTDIYEMTGYYPTGDASGWITVNTDANHNVTSITANTTAGVRTIRPDDFLAKCLGVISMNITRFQYNASNGTWTIESNGHGHGVGMSQCGAAGYIANGQDWRWVLNHYYPRTTIAQIA